jgi:pimeloyl-ACP methyl ester carboxylesterase
MTNFLLVHGATLGAWSWERVLPGLAEAGHTARAIDLPGAGADKTPLADVTLDRYADAICEALADASPTLLTGHSMGGMSITQAAARCPEAVAGLIYVAAFLPQPGQSLLDITRLPEAAGDSVQANLVVEGDPPVATMPAAAAPEALYHCCTPEQTEWALPRRSPQPVVPFTQPFVAPEYADAFDAAAARLCHLPSGPSDSARLAASAAYDRWVRSGDRDRHRPLALAFAPRGARGGSGPDREGMGLTGTGIPRQPRSEALRASG